MGLLTTTIGAFPKPNHVKITDWFKLGMDTPDPTGDYAAELEGLGMLGKDLALQKLSNLTAAARMVE